MNIEDTLMKIYKLLTVLTLTLLNISAAAQSLPDILGTIQNEVGGSIIFTTRKTKECRETEWFVYAKEKNGRVGIGGCYTFLGEKEIVARWFDGSVYSYNVESLEVTDEFIEFMKQREQNQGPTT